VPAAERLPVLFKYTPYLRTFTIFDRDGKNLISDLFEMPWWQRAYLRMRYWFSDRGHLMDPLFRTRWLERMVRHGYAVVVVERSGTGASSGVADLSHAAAAAEASAILDWIAAQPWSNGRVGMYGESFQAMVQFAAASSGNPHLKAIFPASSSFDAYDLTFSGGVYNKGFQSFFTWAMSFLERVVTPVDADRDGAQLAKVIAERRGRTAGEQSTRFKDFPYRDSATPRGQPVWRIGSVHALIEDVNRANVPAYLTTGWLDIFACGRPAALPQSHGAEAPGRAPDRP
jgi:putative CocE/NonD family hydrolase